MAEKTETKKAPAKAAPKQKKISVKKKSKKKFTVPSVVRFGKATNWYLRSLTGKIRIDINLNNGGK